MSITAEHQPNKAEVKNLRRILAVAAIISLCLLAIGQDGNDIASDRPAQIAPPDQGTSITSTPPPAQIVPGPKGDPGQPGAPGPRGHQGQRGARGPAGRMVVIYRRTPASHAGIDRDIKSWNPASVSYVNQHVAAAVKNSNSAGHPATTNPDAGGNQAGGGLMPQSYMSNDPEFGGTTVFDGNAAVKNGASVTYSRGVDGIYFNTEPSPTIPMWMILALFGIVALLAIVALGRYNGGGGGVVNNVIYPPAGGGGGGNAAPPATPAPAAGGGAVTQTPFGQPNQPAGGGQPGPGGDAGLQPRPGQPGAQMMPPSSPPPTQPAETRLTIPEIERLLAAGRAPATNPPAAGQQRRRGGGQAANNDNPQGGG